MKCDRREHVSQKNKLRLTELRLMRVPVDFMKPLLDIIKALKIGGVVDDDNTMSASVIA